MSSSSSSSSSSSACRSRQSRSSGDASSAQSWLSTATLFFPADPSVQLEALRARQEEGKAAAAARTVEDMLRTFGADGEPRLRREVTRWVFWNHLCTVFQPTLGSTFVHTNFF